MILQMLVAVCFNVLLAEEPIPNDPFQYLENNESPETKAWVEAQTEKTKKQLYASDYFGKMWTRALDYRTSPKRPDFGGYREGFFYNFWQDASHPKGILRRATVESYKKSPTQWETVFDVEYFIKKNKLDPNLTYAGVVRLRPDNPNWGLMTFSLGGGDTRVTYEVDLKTNSIIPYEEDPITRKVISNGFYIPPAKSVFAVLDDETLLVATDWGKDSLTNSGYPRIIKVLKRGQRLEEARELIRVPKHNIDVGSRTFYKYSYPSNRNRFEKLALVYQHVGFKDATNYYIYEDERLKKLRLPMSSSIYAFDEGYVYFIIQKPEVLDGETFAKNSFFRAPLTSLLETASNDNPRSALRVEPIFTLPAHTDLADLILLNGETWVKTRSGMTSQTQSFRFGEPLEHPITDELGTRYFQAYPVKLPVPEHSDYGVVVSNDPKRIEKEAYVTLSFTDWTNPRQQYQFDFQRREAKLLKKGWSNFKDEEFTSTLRFATSKDGTKVPYTVLHRKDVVWDGQRPTILYGYGGFGISMDPAYAAVAGQYWLQPGGVYVVANIRGGNEFGPKWHEDALRGKRQNAYDDFIAVAEDLIKTNVSNPSHLGIYGGSNGGLLVGNVVTQRPDLFSAAISAVPLLDMLRFHKLFAGASWMDEYGNPDNAEDCKHLTQISPYHQVSADKKYPEILWLTSNDDRVHPGHARKMQARMESLGHKSMFFEKSTGGHTGDMDPMEVAQDDAIKFTYFWEKLGPKLIK